MKKPTDQQIDAAIGLILRTGVIAAAVLVLAGGVAYLLHPTGAPRAADLMSMTGIWRGALSRHPLYIIQLGLLVLMATPVVRVIACAIGFGLEHDWTYVLISLIVLGLLLASLL